MPKALIELQFNRQFNEIHYHQQYFPINLEDDVWLPQVGQRGWTLIGHDSQHHIVEAEMSAIKQYNVGCFCLWGAEAKRWEKMQCFARAYERIVEAEKTTPRPFIYKVSKMGALKLIPIS